MIEWVGNLGNDRADYQKNLKAEYGTFLPDGLADVTGVLRENLGGNALTITASRKMLRSGDPAPGYKKELRVAYTIGETVYEKNAIENEPFSIDASGQEELKIQKAVFGRFGNGVAGIPPGGPVYDVTEAIQRAVAAGELNLAVDDHLVDSAFEANRKRALRVVYSANGEEYTKTIPKGRVFSFAQATPASKLITNQDALYWVTPYAGSMTYTTSAGATETIKVESVPETIELAGAWEVSFPSKDGEPTQTTFDGLSSWSVASDDAIRYFSGTASYQKQFTLSQQILDSGNSLELDLGSVFVIAEVSVNGQDVGLLWKAPYRVNIDDFVKEGVNDLEIKITNLWPNRLIGDEQLPSDFERKGPYVKQWPDWLLNQSKRPSERVSFAAFKHWHKDSSLQTSGLLGPVRIIPSAVRKVEL